MFATPHLNRNYQCRTSSGASLTHAHKSPPLGICPRIFVYLLEMTFYVACSNRAHRKYKLTFHAGFVSNNLSKHPNALIR